MRALFLAPFPPPHSGQALVSEALFEYLSIHNAAVGVDLSEGTRHDGSFQIGRIPQLLRVIIRILRLSRHIDVVYLTISESILGNIKDLLIYLIFSRRLQNVVVHLHGGSLALNVLNKSKVLKKINGFFLHRIGAVIVSSSSHQEMLYDALDLKNIKIVQNFAPDNMFRSDEEIKAKFHNTEVLKILYLGSMYESKGYLTLLRAVQGLPSCHKMQFTVDFAGKFANEADRRAFETEIAEMENVAFHGVVTEEKKQQLFAKAQVFCLPTNLLEGQPISIIEAYASGCYVLASNPPGIADIFSHAINGEVIAPADVKAWTSSLSGIIEKTESLRDVAIYNQNFATQHFQLSDYVEKINAILNDCV